MNIVLMASGNGSNVVNLVNYSKHLMNVTIVGIIVDRKSSALLNIKFNIPVYFIEKKKSMNSIEHESLILEKVKELNASFILLCGYMRILSPYFLNHFYDDELKQNRVFNIHPSLLPKYVGAHAYHDAYISGDSESGVTVHFVDEGMDTGTIFKQIAFPRLETDSFDDFVNKGKAIEWEIYPYVLDWLEQL